MVNNYKKSHIKVSAVVVTYNRLSLLKECIKHLLSQKYELNNIIVINNNSSDGTRTYLDSVSNKKIKPFNMKKNLGGAGGFSIGTKFAYENSDSDYFWIMDDDAMPTKTALSELIKSTSFLHGDFGFLCSNVRWWKNDEPSYLNIPRTSSDWNDKLTAGLVKTNSASFVSLFVPRVQVRDIGLPIADMFIWGDDEEYTTRLSNQLPSYLVANSIVIHNSKSNSTDGSIYNVSMNRLIYYKCMFRNRLYISKKYYKCRKTLKLLVKDMLILVKIPFVSKTHRFKRFIFTLTGVINGFFFNPKIRFPK